MKIKVDGENIDFIVSYIEKYINPSIRCALSSRLSEQLAWFSDYDELDSETVKKMMTAYRVSKKRKSDKEAGNELVTISITKESHKILKDMAALFNCNLVDVVQLSRLQCNADLAGEVRGLVSSCEGFQKSNEDLRFELQFYKEKYEAEMLQSSKYLEMMVRDSKKSDLLRSMPDQQDLDIIDLKKENESLKRNNQFLTKIISDLQTVDIFQSDCKPQQCQALTVTGQQCKRTNDLLLSDGVLLCNVHLNQQKKGVLKVSGSISTQEVIDLVGFVHDSARSH